MSALAGGDCIDDANALRAGGTERVLGLAVKAASTLGTFLRSFRFGDVRQLDAVTREVLARAFAAGVGPGAEPFTIDLDSTICETPPEAGCVPSRVHRRARLSPAPRGRPETGAKRGIRRVIADRLFASRPTWRRRPTDETVAATRR